MVTSKVNVEKASTKGEEGIVKKIKILIVDDHSMVREGVKMS